MILSLLSRRLTAGFHGLNSTIMNTAMRLYSGAGCKSNCPKTFPCVMEYPKKKCEPPECQPKEAACMKPSACIPVKEDPCKPRPECCGSKRLALDPCNCKGARKETKSKPKMNRDIPQNKSAWEWPIDCCKIPCPDQLPRFDTLYYSPSDKNKRQYQQTWVECPPVLIKKRKICCYDSTVLPPICRRQIPECPKSACELNSEKLKTLACPSTNKKCPRITLPCCGGSRYPPACRSGRKPSDCKKRCCPYPAFSECCHPCPPAKRPVECSCLEQTHQCLVYRYLKRKLHYNLYPPLPAWPPQMIGPR